MENQYTLNTKIIATVGPATLKPEIFNQLVDAGIDYVRINTSYGDTDQYDRILANIKTSRKPDIQVILDIKGIDKLSYAKDHAIRHIALSFVENPEQLSEVRTIVPEAFLIAKIESEQGVRAFDQILELADGIMVARGDLGKAVTLEKVPPLQKDFTLKTVKAEKFLITATEMLLSMVHNPTPTRAEVSDVANAVFSDTSAIMLSEETAIGSYPVEAVDYMRRIALEAEKWKRNHANTHEA